MPLVHQPTERDAAAPADDRGAPTDSGALLNPAGAQPSVTLITIALNNLDGLRRTLDYSTRLHEIQDRRIEGLVIDGGSTDGTIGFLESLPSTVKWVSEQDSGVYNAMNKGVAMARTDYVLFLNSGDHLVSASSIVRALPHLGNHDLCYFDLEIREPSDSEHHATWIKRYPDQLRFSHFVDDSLPHPACFIRRTLFERFGPYDESLRICADWKAFMLWVCRHGCTYKHVPEVLSVFYADGISSRPESRQRLLAEREAVLQTEFPAFLTDAREYLRTRNTASQVDALRRSRVIRILQRAGLMWDF